MVPTKIVATVGPASCSEDVLARFLTAGVDVVRLNMSHGTHEDHKQAIDIVRALDRERHVHVAVLADLCGPKVRTAVMDSNADEIHVGDSCEIVRDPIEGDARRFGTNYSGLVDAVKVGDRVLIDDGLIRLRVSAKEPGALVCTCEAGGAIGTRKGINVPDSDLPLPAMTEKDHVDVAWAIEHGVDFVALSFVRRADDVVMLRETLDRLGSDVPILAKIETPQAISDIDAIIRASNGVMVARGDLGVEMDVTQVPMLQKDIVRRCRNVGKPVIIATQMLHSMVHSSSPTRAEVSDVANAVLDGADAVMLSAESATGRYPVESVAMMNRICEEASKFDPTDDCRWADAPMNRVRVGHTIDRTTSAVARSAAMVAHDLGAKLIAAWCRSGRTIRWLSKYRGRQPLAGLSSRGSVCRRLSLSYDVDPILVSPEMERGEGSWHQLEELLVERFGLRVGDIIVVVGDPRGPKKACTISIRVVGD